MANKVKKVKKTKKVVKEPKKVLKENHFVNGTIRKSHRLNGKQVWGVLYNGKFTLDGIHEFTEKKIKEIAKIDTNSTVSIVVGWQKMGKLNGKTVYVTRADGTPDLKYNQTAFVKASEYDKSLLMWDTEYDYIPDEFRQVQIFYN